MKGKSKQFSFFIHSSFDTKKRETVFNDIWKEYYPKLTVYLATTYSLADTEDIAQEVMLKVYNNLHRYNPLYSFNTWIYSIARNCRIDSFRRNSKSTKVLVAIREGAETTSLYNTETPEFLLLQKTVKNGIAECIANLPEREREISFLKFYEDLTYREISSILEIPAGTVKYLVHNIKKDVEAHYLGQYGE